MNTVNCKGLKLNITTILQCRCMCYLKVYQPCHSLNSSSAPSYSFSNGCHSLCTSIHSFTLMNLSTDLQPMCEAAITRPQCMRPTTTFPIIPTDFNCQRYVCCTIYSTRLLYTTMSLGRGFFFVEM